MTIDEVATNGESGATFFFFLWLVIDYNACTRDIVIVGDLTERDEEDRVSASNFFAVTLGESVEFVGHGLEPGVTGLGVGNEVLVF